MKIIAVFITLTLAYAYHGCTHDKYIQNKKLIPINDTWKSGRLLQQLTYGPIRFHFIHEKEIQMNTAVNQMLLKIMSIIKLFWQKTIEVYYQETLPFNVPEGLDKSLVMCNEIQIPPQIIDNPIKDADYGIFVFMTKNVSDMATAQSSPCAYSLTTKRPTWGFVKWNTTYFKFDTLNFQMSVKTGIHQFTHLLGFTSSLIPNFVYGKIVVKDRFSYINGTYIQKAIRDQYGCTTAPGMPLQMEGGAGTVLSHWSYKAVFNEYMAEGVAIHNPTISFITLALLQETGWYKAIYKGYGQYLNWGYKKGCSVLYEDKCSSDQYCKKEMDISCSYDATGYGTCKRKGSKFCLFTSVHVDNACINPNYNRWKIAGESAGQYSRCFQSNLVQLGADQTLHPFRCYKTMCSLSGKTLTIQVGSTLALCLFPRQKITVPGYTGFLTCPKNFKRLCSVKRCPKQCEGNGVCLNGRCLCLPNYSGQSCNQVTSVGFASKTPISMASRNGFCLLGSYKNFFGNCQRCAQGCGICDEKGCQVCMDGSLPGEDSCHNI